MEKNTQLFRSKSDNAGESQVHSMPGTAVGPDYGLMEDTAQCALEIHAWDLQGHAPALGSVCRNPTNLQPSLSLEE